MSTHNESWWVGAEGDCSEPGLAVLQAAWTSLPMGLLLGSFTCKTLQTLSLSL